MAPTRWWQVKVGPAMRRERDLRLYTGMFAPEPWAVDGPLRAWSRQILPEPVRLGHEPRVLKKDELIVFRGLADYFDRLAPHRALIAERLALVSRLSVSPEVFPVAAHVRRGDFSLASRTGDEWFLGVARSLRALGYTELIPLFSDGTIEELAPLLDEGFVRQQGGSALEDLWALANSRILLASGASTFSSWGAFLGSALTVGPADHDITGLDRWFSGRVQRVECVGPDLSKRMEDALSGVLWE